MNSMGQMASSKVEFKADLEREPALMGGVLEGRDIVVFSNDWDGDPLSKTHIMLRLARQNRILWVNSIGNRAPRANVHDFRRLWKKLSSFASGMSEVVPNLFVFTPLALPWYGSKTVRAANRKLLNRQIRRAMRKLGFRQPISWSFLPASAPVSGTLGEELVIYHCVDEFSAFADTNPKHIAELEEQLLRNADLVITSAERLRSKKALLNPHTVLVRHGVDFHHFVKACDPMVEVPADIARLPRPIIGFYGLVAEWVDLNAFLACAAAHPKGSVVIIGRVAPDVDDSPLRRVPNIHLLGHRPYEQLPGYCRGFDLAMMPFKLNELTLSANPLKVREYLAAGLPCVASDLPEVRKIGLCKLARSPEDFVRKVDECLQEGTGPRRERAQKMLHESWEARVEDIRRHVGEALARRRWLARS
jgi:glycosyltransferase involved in cell wall biosynthesis